MARARKPQQQRLKRRDDANADSEQSFPIVGVGASAGGLEAISEFLRHIPARTGLAFVLVEHLDPFHRSDLSAILSRTAHIPVDEVREGTAVKPDHAYVIPPNVSMYIERGTLHLAPRTPQVPNLPVDRFLCSLAAEHQHQSIGVILSGTASDGVEGCRMIKAVGGITFAQTAGSAKYSSMPQSAVDAGCVDFVLSPREIAEQLVQIGAHPYVSAGPNLEALSQSDHVLREVLQVVSDRTGIDFAQYKSSTLRRRILRRMALHKFSDLKDYLRYLKETPKEAEDLYRDILITVTDFFRDAPAFEMLKRNVYSRLLAERDPQSDLRIWVPGCATGEEAYSIAMALMEFTSRMPQNPSLLRVHIFATDVNEISLAKARLGIYSPASVKDLTADQLNRFFVKQDGMYQVQKAVREMCVFAKQNLAKDPPFSNLDLISCRNLLIYFGEPLQTRVIPMFHYALRPGGFLMLGGSETLGKFADQFVVIDKKYKIFQKKKDSPQLLSYFVNAGVISPETVFAAPGRIQSGSTSLERQFDKVLLETFGPTSIVVTEDLEIVHLRGNTGKYLQPPSGQALFNLNRMAREGLLLDLRTAIKTARKAGNAVRLENLEVRTDRGPAHVSVEVHPFSPPGSREDYYIIGFQDVPPPAQKAKRSGARGRDGNKVRRHADTLRRELAHVKDQLKSLIEDHETTLQEYRSSSEEVLSSNEELQSLNEELETGKEELQSTNEELRTVNEELQNRNAEMHSASDDLSNLVSNVGIAALMVSNDLIIRRSTPVAQTLLNLMPEDIGHRISELQPHLRDVNLAEIARDTISSISPQEREIQGKDGTWYLMRVRPYKTSDQRIAGAVFVFQDIDLFKRSLDDSRKYTMTLIESAREPIIVLDGSLRVINANNAFYRKFFVGPEETEGRFIYELGRGQWNLPKLRTLLEDILPAHSRIDDFEVHAAFPQIGEKVMRLNARRIESHTGQKNILLTIEDITEVKQSEKALQELSMRLLNIEDEQRRSFARDLHDDTGQKVAALALNIRLLAKQVPDAEKNRTIRETLELAEKITNEIRGLSYVLHPPMQDELGLGPALREYVKGVSERTGLRIQLTIQDEFPSIRDEFAITIFRIVQECLTNVHRHSASREATIELTHNGNEIQLRIADPGPGINHEVDKPVNSQKRKLGVGIAGMKERVKHLRGTLDFVTGGSGTTVIARIPVPKDYD